MQATQFNKLFATKKTEQMKSLNRNSAEDLLGQMHAELYWFSQNPQWFRRDGRGRKFHALMKKQIRRLAKMIARDIFPDELTATGSALKRDFTQFGGWGYLRRHLAKNDGDSMWDLYRSEDAYHLLFSNEKELKIFEYVEGDVYLVQCPDKLAFNLELFNRAQYF